MSVFDTMTLEELKANLKYWKYVKDINNIKTTTLNIDSMIRIIKHTIEKTTNENKENEKICRIREIVYSALNNHEQYVFIKQLMEEQ